MKQSILTHKTKYPDLPTTDLVLLSQQKDEAALSTLLQRHQGYISNKLYQIAPDWSDQSDLIQEINIRIWRFIRQLRKPDSFRPWLCQLITNVFYDELRKRPRNVQIVSLDEPIPNESRDECTRDIKDCSRIPDDMLLAKELSEVLLKAMQNVPVQFKIAEMLRDIQGLSYDEIAEITHAELGTVKSRIARARMRIQDSIASYVDECA